MERQEHHIKIQRTARYYTAGELNENTQEVWFVLHGWAQLAHDFLLNFSDFQNPNRFFVAPEALNRFYLKGGFDDVGATWMTKQDRDAEIADYVNYLDKLYISVLNGKITANTQITVLGFSQGATTVSRWLYQSENRFDRLILYAGEPAAELQNEKDLRKLSKAQNYYFTGTRDHIFTKERLAVFRPFLPDFHFIEFDGSHRVKGGVLKDFFG